MFEKIENRAIYDPAKDAVATLSFSLECHPKAVRELSQYLFGVAEKAGVYVVHEISSTVTTPEVIGELGAAHAEPELQPGREEPQADIGAGGEAAAGTSATERAADEDSGVAGTAGEVGTEPLGGGDESASLPEVRGAVEDTAQSDSGPREGTGTSEIVATEK